jgi:hypothetical protein
MFISSIQEIIKNGDSNTQKQFQDTCLHFKCSKDLDVENFLHNKAVIYDFSHQTRTYICYDKGFIAGYFTLTTKNLDLTDAIPKNYRKKLTYGHTKTNSISAYLLAQMGKDDRCSVKNVGRLMLTISQETVKSVQSKIGGRVMYLECKNNEKLKKLYEEIGFRYLQMNKNLMQMVKII